MAKKSAVKKSAVKKTVAQKTAVKKTSPKEAQKPARKTAPTTPKKTASQALINRNSLTTAKPKVRPQIISRGLVKPAVAAKKLRLTKEQLKIRERLNIEMMPNVDNKPLKKGEIKELAATLLVERDRLAKEINDLQRLSLMNEDENGKDTDTYSIHPAESASDYAMMEMTLLQNSHETLLLQMINECMEKLDNGIYGICERCSAYIGYERLSAKPWARLCIVCRDNIERGKI
ncbi:TraR/DksA C4-type zinc finger protein [Candidatus Sumerlaeota bacterium]|nr:TraR/DksA C4-type zinc finger protein [Candidatus Sumerlaeota bacterium]